MRVYGFGYRVSRQSSGIDPQAQAFYDNVLADGGIVSEPLSYISDIYKAIKQARGQSDINNCFLSNYHAPFGLKLAAGVGATAGNRACAKLYNLIGTTNDAEQISPANQPLALVHSGSNYVYSPGVTGNFFSTPNAAANQIYGDFSLQIIINIRSLSFAQTIYSKWGGLNILGIDITSGGILQINYHNGVVRQVVSAPGFITTGLQTLTITRNSTTGKWFANGVDLGGVAGDLSASTSVINIGSFASNGGQTINGEIFRLRVWANDSLSGVPNLDFNPNNYNRATSQTTWTSTTGEVWTLNTPATNNALKAAIVDQTMVMGNGSSYGLRAANLNINQTAITNYVAFRKFVNTAGDQIINELGQNAVSLPGFALRINGFAGFESLELFANVGRYNNNFAQSSFNLALRTSVRNINNANESAPFMFNNSNIDLTGSSSAANNTAAMNATGYNLLSRNNAAGSWANAILISDSICAGEDSPAIRTAMWDIYQSLLKIA